MYLEAIEYTLGGYATEIKTETLTNNNSEAGKPTPELVPLINARFARASELKAGNVLNDATLKQCTGNAHIRV